ncbi:MAG: GTP-binding protein [Acutalibacter sp.]
MKRLVIGILAHVDSGKTTLSEAMLYRAGALRKLGRVDHRNAFLDTDALERARGITIFSKQAVLKLPDTQLTLLDTPGHVDFSTEAERALQVMDYAILVVSGTDGVQSHTETLWRLLERYHVPVFLFVNKMDLAGADKAARLEELRRRFGTGCLDLSDPACGEDLALCNEELLETVMAGESPTEGQLGAAIARRELFPCYFGSALKLEGVDKLLEDLERLTQPLPQREAFGARVFKVTKEDVRLTWVKVTGGELKVKAELSAREDARSPGAARPTSCGCTTGPSSSWWTRPCPGTWWRWLGSPTPTPGRGWAANRTPARPLWSRCCGTGCCCPRASTCTRPWASCGSWSRRTRSFTWCGTSAWGRCTCS